MELFKQPVNGVGLYVSQLGIVADNEAHDAETYTLTHSRNSSDWHLTVAVPKFYLFLVSLYLKEA